MSEDKLIELGFRCVSRVRGEYSLRMDNSEIIVRLKKPVMVMLLSVSTTILNCQTEERLEHIVKALKGE